MAKKRKKRNSNKKKESKKIPVEVLKWMRKDLIRLEESVKNDVTPAVVASFGFIIALVWRDAIAGALDKFLENAGLTEKAYLYNFLSAAIITIIVIGIMILVSKYGKSRREKRIKKAVNKKTREIEEVEE